MTEPTKRKRRTKAEIEAARAELTDQLAATAETLSKPLTPSPVEKAGRNRAPRTPRPDAPPPAAKPAKATTDLTKLDNDSLISKVQALESELENYKVLTDLLAHNIEFQEENLASVPRNSRPYFAEVVKAYRKVRPKTTKAQKGATA